MGSSSPIFGVIIKNHWHHQPENKNAFLEGKIPLLFYHHKFAGVFPHLAGVWLRKSPETSSYPWLCLRCLKKKILPKWWQNHLIYHGRIRIKSPKKTNIFVPKMVIFPSKTLDTLVVFSHVTLPKVNHWTKRIDAYLTGISTKLTSVLARFNVRLCRRWAKENTFPKTQTHRYQTWGIFQVIFLTGRKKNRIVTCISFQVVASF